MADIRLAKPAAGASESVQCAPDARFVFDFPTTDATLAREGDNLNIRFEDGSQLQLQGFYQEYNGENLPSFNIDGTEVAAADFFQAMNEPDLMPAAGPGTGTVANGARFHEWGDSALTGGLLHLDGLDWGFSRSFEWEDHPNAVGYDDDGWRGAANTVPDLDVPVAPERPYDPRNPGDDPNNPASPQNPGGYIPNTHGASIVVDEGALAKGSGQHVLHGVHDYGSFVADVHAERGGSIELSFGGKVVTLEIPRDGSLRIAASGDASFANVNGVDIRILGAQSTGDGKWVVRYEYRLGDHIDHDKLLGQDTVRYDGEGIAITVTDGSGDVTRGRITVEVHDDVPLLRVLSAPAVIRDSVDKVTANIDGLSFGADDEDAKTLTINVKSDDLPDEQGVTYTYAIEALPGGGYTFTSDEEGAPTLQLEGHGSYTLTYTRPDGHAELDTKVEASANTYTFTVTVTDSDGDAVGRDVTVTTKPAPFIIVGPDPKPDPDPDNPDNPDDPDNPEDPKLKVADPDTAASTVVTDDSNQEDGTSYGKAVSDGGYGGTSPSASSSFGLLLNGLDYTLTITGKTGPAADAPEKTLTIELNADGSFKSFSVNGGASSTDAGSLAKETLYGDFGEINDIHITPPQPGGNQSQVSYTYTQTKPFSHTHDKPTDPENTEDERRDAETFGITLNDGLHDEVESFIQVKIEDDEPEAGVLAVKDQRPKKPETADDDANAGGAEVPAAGEGTGDDTPPAAIADSAGTITALLKDMTFGADNGDDKTLTITVVKAGDTSEPKPYEYTITDEEDGHYTFTPKDGAPDAPTLTYNADKGGYELTYTRAATEVDKGNEFDAKSDTYTFKVTVTDDDGDPDACSVTVSTIPEPLIIQGPKPGPEPTPAPDPDGPVVANMENAAGWVVTDDSYLEGGNRGQQGISQDGAGTASEVESSFDLKLNGLKYTLTIEGKDSDGADAHEKTLTIELTAEGKVESFSVSVDGKTIHTEGESLANVELYGAYGKISVTGAEPKEDGNRSTVSYTYTQTKPYSHTGGDGETNPQDELQEKADQFKITLADHMHDQKSSFIRVDIEDDAPEAGVLTVTNTTPAATAGETTPPAGDESASGSGEAAPAEGTVPPHAEIKDSDGEITALLKGMTFGADNGKDKTLTITVEKAGDNTSGSKSYEYTVTDGEDGHYTFTSKDGASNPTLMYKADKDGYELSYSRNGEEVQQDNNQNATSDTYTFKVTVQDADGDVDDCSVTVTTRPGVFIIPGGNPEEVDTNGLVASRVTTDDSYLTAGTKQPPKAAQVEETAAQAASDEVSDGNSAPTSSANDGLSNADSATSNFTLQLNGLECVLTIEGKKPESAPKNANTLKIVLDDAGHLKSYTYTDAEGKATTVPWDDPEQLATSLAGVELTGAYGHISGIRIAPVSSSNQVEVTYTYTQEKAYSHQHEAGEDNKPDELSPAGRPAETFDLTLSDRLHDPVSSSIKVDIEDDEPLLSLSVKDLGIALAGQEADKSGTLDFNFGADNGTDKSLTVTVEGQDGKEVTSTLAINEDGTLEGSKTIQGKHGVLTIKASTDVDGKYTYTYTANQDAVNGEKDTFQFTITDADGDVVISDAESDPNQLVITVKNPVIEPVKVSEKGLMSEADTSKTAVVNVPEGWMIVEGSYNGDHGQLTQDEQGNWQYTLTRRVDHRAQGEDWQEPGDTVKVKLTDGERTYEAVVRVDIQDDMDGLTPNVYEGKISGLTSQTHISFVPSNGETISTRNGFQDLDANGNPLGDSALLGENKWTITSAANMNIYRGIVQTVELFSSSVKYNYNQVDGKWTIEEMADTIGKEVGVRQNFILTSDGLGIVQNRGQNDPDYNWGNEQLSTAPKENGNQITAAEAIVLENTNKSASYGLEIEFYNFESNDRALVVFYLTPQHSDDNNIVFMKEVSNADIKNVDGVKKVCIDVPDGFTKAIIAPLPGGDGMNNQSEFTIKSLDLTRLAYEHSGKVTVVNDADSNEKFADKDHQADLKWDWGDVAAAMKDGVTLQGTMYDGDYTLDWSKAQNKNGEFAGEFSVYLKYSNADPERASYDGNPLFKASLNADGKWKITQYYDFVLKDGKEPVFDVKFTITDGDGDVTALPQQINMSQPDLQDRFQNVVNGYWNEAVNENGNKYWDAWAGFNKVTDVLAGNEENDLINGLGGNDILFGDGGDKAWRALADVSLEITKGITTDLVEYVHVYDPKEDVVDKYEAEIADQGYTNVQLHQKLYDSLSTATNQQIDEFAMAMEDRETRGGDDALLGGLGNDILFGGAGDDYLVGNGLDKQLEEANRQPDQDIIFGGSGADIILYDDKRTSDNKQEDNHGDLIVHGGSGIDVLLVGNTTTESLSDLMDPEKNLSGTKVMGIEVMIRNNNTSHAENLGVTSLSTLESRCGVTIDSKNETMTLSSDWKYNESAGTYSLFDKDKGLNLTLETHNLEMITGENGKGFTFKNMEVHGKEEFQAKGAIKVGTIGNDMLVSSTDGAAALAIAKTYDDFVQHRSEIKAELDANEEITATGSSTIRGGRGDNVILNTNEKSVLIGDGAAKDDLHSALDDGDGNKNVTNDINALKNLSKDIDAITQKANDLEKAESRLETIHDGDDTIYSHSGTSLMHGGGGDDQLINDGGGAILIGGSGDDTLLGCGSKEFLFGGSGDDFINGNGGSDVIFAGSGDDLIVYNSTDYLIDGGEGGIDFLLTDDLSAHSLDAMIQNWEKQSDHEVNMPMVHDVEVMLKGVDLNLQNMSELAEKYGFTVKHVGGKDILELNREKWEEQKSEELGKEGNEATRTITYKFKDDQSGNGTDGAPESSVTLETTLEQTDLTETTIVLTHIVANSQG